MCVRHILSKGRECEKRVRIKHKNILTNSCKYRNGWVTSLEKKRDLRKPNITAGITDSTSHKPITM